MTSDHNLRSLKNDDVFTTLIKDHEYCPMDFDKLDSMLVDVEASWATTGTKAKGRTLEDVSVYLLSCVEPFDVTYDEHTPMNQIDGFIEVLAFKGNNLFLSEIGNYFIAECKNENDPVDIGQVEKVGAILHNHQWNFAVIFSRKNLTGAGKFEDAQAYVMTQKLLGKRILNLTYADLKAMSTTKSNFLTFLRRKNKELVLLQLRPNVMATELKKYHDLYKEGALTKEDYDTIKEWLMKTHIH